MGKISFIVTNSGTINAVANGQQFSIPSDHHNYLRVKQALVNDDVDDFVIQANLTEALKSYVAPAATNPEVGEVTIVDGKVMWNGQEMHNAVSKRILLLRDQGFPFEPMMKFLTNLMRNPSYRSCTELYNFLDREGLPVTDDGCFLGYKRVRDDWTDCHTGTVDNSIGKIIEMPRNMVDDNWMNDCSAGYHVGSIDYVRGFHSGSGHVLIVKVNPADVVSVPQYATNKLRTCKYEVLKEYDRNLVDPLKETLYTSTGEVIEGKEVVNYSGIDPDELDKKLDDISASPAYPKNYDDDEDDMDEDDNELDDSELDEEEEEEIYYQTAINNMVQDAIKMNVDATKLAFKLHLDPDYFNDRPVDIYNVIKIAYDDEDMRENYIRSKFN